MVLEVESECGRGRGRIGGCLYGTIEYRHDGIEEPNSVSSMVDRDRGGGSGGDNRLDKMDWYWWIEARDVATGRMRKLKKQKAQSE